jgi:hypothetical protein
MDLVAFISISPKSRRKQVTHAHEVVAGERQQSRVFDLVPTAELWSPQQTNVFAPTEGLLDELPRLQAQRVSGVAGCAAVDRRTPVPIDVLRNVWRRLDLAQLRHEAAGVVGLVGGDRAGRLCSNRLDHLDRTRSLSRAVRLADLHFDHEAMTVLAHPMTHVTELGSRAGTLSIEHGLRIRGRGMRIVAARLTVKITGLIASAATRLIIRPILWPVAAVRGPGLDQRSVNAEMLVAEQSRGVGLLNNRVEQVSCDIGTEQSVAVLAESRVVPDRLVDRQPHKPAKQQVVLELLDQQPLAADRIEHLQQQSANQALRRDRWTPILRVQAFELAIHLGECFGNDRPNRAQRVVRRDPALRRDVAEHSFLPRIGSAHPLISISRSIIRTVPYAQTFSTAC